MATGTEVNGYADVRSRFEVAVASTNGNISEALDKVDSEVQEDEKEAWSAYKSGISRGLSALAHNGQTATIEQLLNWVDNGAQRS